MFICFIIFYHSDMGICIKISREKKNNKFLVKCLFWMVMRSLCTYNGLPIKKKRTSMYLYRTAHTYTRSIGIYTYIFSRCIIHITIILFYVPKKYQWVSSTAMSCGWSSWWLRMVMTCWNERDEWNEWDQGVIRKKKWTLERRILLLDVIFACWLAGLH